MFQRLTKKGADDDPIARRSGSRPRPSLAQRIDRIAMEDPRLGRAAHALVRRGTSPQAGPRKAVSLPMLTWTPSKPICLASATAAGLPSCLRFQSVTPTLNFTPLRAA
jgi:hypothetical protein